MSAMIRTRDFLLFTVAFVFIFYGIAGTVWLDLSNKSANAPVTEIEFKTSKVVTGAVIKADEDNRQENIARLQAKLAKGEGNVSAGPPIFTSVDETPSTTSQIEATYCSGTTENHDSANAWPVGQVKNRAAEGARIFYTESFGQVGTTTAASEKVLLQLPITPLVGQESNCLTGEVVGVTISGALIYNDQPFALPRSGLVGYALDGFPIYGEAAWGAELDSCGGINSEFGYGYYLQSESDVVLGCFVGTPQKFNL